jgi:hypothetical protein
MSGFRKFWLFQTKRREKHLVFMEYLRRTGQLNWLSRFHTRYARVYVLRHQRRWSGSRYFRDSSAPS